MKGNIFRKHERRIETKHHDWRPILRADIDKYISIMSSISLLGILNFAMLLRVYIAP